LDSLHCPASPCGLAAAGPGSPPATPAAAEQTETDDRLTAKTDSDLERVSKQQK